MFDSMELVTIKKLAGKVTSPIDSKYLPEGHQFGTEVSEILPETTVEFSPETGQGMIVDVLSVVLEPLIEVIGSLLLGLVMGLLFSFLSVIHMQSNGTERNTLALQAVLQ